MSLALSGGEGSLRPGRQILVWCPEACNGLGLAGIPLWKRAVYSACRAGFERLLIVSDGAADKIRGDLDGDPRLKDRSWEGVSTSSGWAEHVARVGGRWVVLSGDWIVDGEFLGELSETRGEPAAVTPDGPLAAEAEEISRWASSGWSPAARQAVVRRTVVPKPQVYSRVSNAKEIAVAEEQIFQGLARNANNFFARYVDRSMSRALSRRLARTSVTPNQITWFSILLGIVGSLMLLHPSYLAGALGSFLFFASTVIDGCDGEIARLKFQESPWGAKLDVIGDNIVHAFLFPCSALRFYFADPTGPFLWLGTVSFGGVIFSWLAVYFLVLRHPSRKRLRFFELFANREFAYLVAVLGLVGRLEWFVWAMTFGLWIFPLGLVALWASEKAIR